MLAEQGHGGVGDVDGVGQKLAFLPRGRIHELLLDPVQCRIAQQPEHGIQCGVRAAEAPLVRVPAMDDDGAHPGQVRRLHPGDFQVPEAQVHAGAELLRALGLGIGKGHVGVLAGRLSPVHPAVRVQGVAGPDHHGPPGHAGAEVQFRARRDDPAEVRHQRSVGRRHEGLRGNKSPGQESAPGVQRRKFRDRVGAVAQGRRPVLAGVEGCRGLAVEVLDGIAFVVPVARLTVRGPR